MPQLELHAFNGFRVLQKGELVRSFRSVKERALLAFLCVEASKVHSRVSLAGLLWPDEAESKARRNLSQTLLNLRRSIADEGVFLEVSSKQIAFKSEHAFVDVTVFASLLSEVQKHEHDDLLSCSVCTAQLQKAVDLYTGSLLEGFFVPESDLFEDWLLSKRNRLEREALEAFTLLSQSYEAQGDLLKSQKVTRRVLEFAPWQEHAHRQLMRLFALEGKRSQAIAQFERCLEVLQQELGIEPSATTKRLYEDVIAGRVRRAEGVAQLEDTRFTPFQVTLPPPHFVGREEERQDIRGRLRESESAVCGLVGMGGVGKSTLAIQLAHDLKQDFPDGVLWANTATSDTMSILENWAKAFDYELSSLSDIESRAAAVRGVLADKSVLIILDNVDQASQAKPLIASRNSSPVLLTTRNLDVAHALNASVMRVGELPAASGLELLKKILGDERVFQEEAAAAELCKLLHYLPLAVEIAGQRLKSRGRMQLSSVAERLKDAQNRLSLEISDLAVRMSFEVSWEALKEEHQRFFPILAVFEGRPFSHEAVAFIAQIDALLAEDYLYTLTALSLVIEEGDAYYRQHPLLADFAKEKLLDPIFRQDRLLLELGQERLGQPDATYERMVEYFLALTKDAYEILSSEQEVTWAAQLEFDHLNIRACIDWVIKAGRIESLERFTRYLYTYWDIRGYWLETVKCFEALFEASEVYSVDAAKRGHYAHTLYRLSRYEDAETQTLYALELAKADNDNSNIAHALRILAIVEDDTRNSEQALKLYQDCLDYLKLTANQDAMSAVFNDMANAAVYVGSYEQAYLYNEQAVDLLEHSNEYVNSIAGLSFALITFYQDKLDEAERFALDAKIALEQLQAVGGLASCEQVLGAVAAKKHDYEKAKRHLEKAISLATRAGDKFELMPSYNFMGSVESALGHHKEALECFQMVLILCQETGIKRNGLRCFERLVCHLLTTNLQLDSLVLAKLLFAAERLSVQHGMQGQKQVADLENAWGKLVVLLTDNALKRTKLEAEKLSFFEATDLALGLMDEILLGP